jgi:MtN3 and saliva related transmembrane protein
MNSVDILGYIASFLIVICYLPQIYKIITTKESKDISMEMYLLLFLGQILYTFYGILKHDVPIIVVNLIGGTLNLFIISIPLKLSLSFTTIFS